MKFFNSGLLVFYVRFDISNKRTIKDRDIDVEVVLWWYNQKPEITLEAWGEGMNALSPDRIPYTTGLLLFSKYLKSFGEKERPQIFGNGSEYDNVILANQYQELNLTIPWDYGANQSVRSVSMMGRYILGLDFKYQKPVKNAHHALTDSRHEAQYCIDILKTIRNRIGD